MIPSLSLVMACFGQRDLTAAAVRTILADVPDVELICVDNGSPDDTVGMLRERAGITVYPLGENRGVSYAWNYGLERARGSVLGVINNDVLIHPGGLRRLREAAVAAGISCLFGGVLDREGKHRGFTRFSHEADYADGCALLFRREVWHRVGCFDEAFGTASYCNDSDWSARARLLGYSWRIVPDAMTHLGGGTAKNLPWVREEHERNSQRLVSRWSNYGLGERILVRRWGAAGDVIMATPALAALRKQYPLAKIHLQSADRVAELLDGIPCVDQVSPHIWPEYTRRFDLDGAYEAAQRSGVWNHPAFAFAARLGVSLSDLRYQVPETLELDGWAERLLPGTGYVACGLRSAFRPLANWTERGWLALLRSRPETKFVLLDPEAQPDVEAKGEHRGSRIYTEPNAIDLTGATPTLRHALALLRRCVACVTVDTALLHMAAALEIPVTGLFGGSASWARLPLTGSFRALSGEAPCYPCLNDSQCSRADGPHCLGGISAERVGLALDAAVAAGR